MTRHRLSSATALVEAASSPPANWRRSCAVSLHLIHRTCSLGRPAATMPRSTASLTSAPSSSPPTSSRRWSTMRATGPGRCRMPSATSTRWGAPPSGSTSCAGTPRNFKRPPRRCAARRSGHCARVRLCRRWWAHGRRPRTQIRHGGRGRSPSQQDARQCASGPNSRRSHQAARHRHHHHRSKRDVVDAATMQAITSMTTTNAAARRGGAAGASGATDVTGFCPFGHAINGRNPGSGRDRRRRRSVIVGATACRRRRGARRHRLEPGLD